MFILITAPSWCGWCVKLEEDVLSKAAFKEYLSENYIGLKLLEKVNGQRNPELPRKFVTLDNKGEYINNDEVPGNGRILPM